MKKVLITGISGQIGSYLTEFLLDKGYEVHGIVRRSSSFNTDRIDHLYNDPKIGYKTLHLHFGDLSDSSSLNRILEKIRPDEIYNLAAQSHVRVSFDIPEYTADVVGTGVLRILDAVKETGIKTRFLQMSSSEMFGGLPGFPIQDENTPFYPKSPYGCAKLFGYWSTKNYRESYDMFASNSITFNTESPRRLQTFVTRKITDAVSRISRGEQDLLYLGNLNAKRDWSYAVDIVNGLWSILQHTVPDDFVLGSGETHTVREFVELAFKEANINIKWYGEGINEVGIDESSSQIIVKIDSRFFRPSEVEILHSNPAKAESILGWKPNVKFKELVKIMMKHDLQTLWKN